MRFPRFALAAAVLAPVLTLAACSRQSAPMIPSQMQPSQRAIAGSTPELAFVGDNAANAFYIFNMQTLKQTGTNTNVCKPQGLASDASGNLYENDLCTHTVQIFSAPYTGKAIATLDDKNYVGYGMTLDKQGNVYVANLEATNGGPGNVAFFDAKKHFRILTRGGPFYFFGVAVDSQGRIWATGTDFLKTPMIGYFQTMKNGFSLVNVDCCADPGDLAFDGQGNLVIDDQQGAQNHGSQLDVIPPGHNKPTQFIPLQTDGSILPYFAFGAGFKTIVVPDMTTGKVYLYSYPGGKLLGTFNSNQVKQGLGAAVIPAP